MFVYDYMRRSRIGQPEVILCEEKPISALKHIIKELHRSNEHSVLFTRLTEEQYSLLESLPKNFDYDALSRTAIMNGCLPAVKGSVAVVSAGTSDIMVSREAKRTLSFLGIEAVLYEDVGVAGLWRLEEKLESIQSNDIVIVIAGMDAAIISVLGGLVSIPVIAVPTSIGYGMAQNGESALRSILCSCAQGIVTVNIDNGFGAACAAARILSAMNPKI